MAVIAARSRHDAETGAALLRPGSAEDHYKDVVAGAVMRAVIPGRGAARALKSVGASTALAALSEFFPLATATDVFAQGAALGET